MAFPHIVRLRLTETTHTALYGAFGAGNETGRLDDGRPVARLRIDIFTVASVGEFATSPGIMIVR